MTSTGLSIWVSATMRGSRRISVMSLPSNLMITSPGSILALARSEEHTSELQSHSDLHSFPTRRSSDLVDLGLGDDARQPAHLGDVLAVELDDHVARLDLGLGQIGRASCRERV